MKDAQGHRPFCSAPVAGLLAPVVMALLLSVSAKAAAPIRFSGELGGLVMEDL